MKIGVGGIGEPRSHIAAADLMLLPSSQGAELQQPPPQRATSLRAHSPSPPPESVSSQLPGAGPEAANGDHTSPKSLLEPLSQVGCRKCTRRKPVSSHPSKGADVKTSGARQGLAKTLLLPSCCISVRASSIVARSAKTRRHMHKYCASRCPSSVPSKTKVHPSCPKLEPSLTNQAPHGPSSRIGRSKVTSKFRKGMEHSTPLTLNTKAQGQTRPHFKRASAIKTPTLSKAKLSPTPLLKAETNEVKSSCLALPGQPASTALSSFTTTEEGRPILAQQQSASSSPTGTDNGGGAGRPPSVQMHHAVGSTREPSVPRPRLAAVWAATEKACQGSCQPTACCGCFGARLGAPTGSVRRVAAALWAGNSRLPSTHVEASGA
mmetsp:Transcript_61066/g.171121  ORF Transcript_61066/g.171121 Transcript_61066/m.171121 type:complete len:378 (+) Transcript_61066:76-1209(+)